MSTILLHAFLYHSWPAPYNCRDEQAGKPAAAMRTMRRAARVKVVVASVMQL
jgi:hypothetical protein